MTLATIKKSWADNCLLELTIIDNITLDWRDKWLKSVVLMLE